ncbi:MAG: DNA adenine methylase [Bacteroidaceae bacterium]|nr:DNA adenine methylase [Bacteroidaceae bacterium]
MIQTFEINNRRYLGNKFKLIPFIRRVVDEECSDVRTVLDAFSGTGSVSFAFRDKRLLVNDMMYCNFLASLCWFSPQEVNTELLIELLEYYNSTDTSREDNYMYQTFRDTYFSADVCRRIGFVREDVEQKYNAGELNERERAVVITSLVYAMDRISNTYGHYDSYIQNATFSDAFELRLPKLDYKLNVDNLCFNMDANRLAAEVDSDLAYLDPPYNSRNYCDAYHLLENVARWEKPAVEGVARKMDRSAMKSEYCKVTANESLEDLVDKLRSRYIMLSYNNNGQKLQVRSNAKISDAEILRILGKRGDVKLFTQDFKPFSAGRGENVGNQERLFLCVVRK